MLTIFIIVEPQLLIVHFHIDITVECLSAATKIDSCCVFPSLSQLQPQKQSFLVLQSCYIEGFRKPFLALETIILAVS